MIDGHRLKDYISSLVFFVVAIGAMYRTQIISYVSQEHIILALILACLFSQLTADARVKKKQTELNNALLKLKKLKQDLEKTSDKKDSIK